MTERDELEAIRIRNKRRYEDDAARWSDKENDSQFETNKLLVTIASFTIPLSFVLLGIELNDETIFERLSLGQRYLIVASLFLLTVSFLVGALNYLLDKYHFGAWLDFSLKAGNFYAERLPDKFDQAEKALDAMNDRYDELLLDSSPPRRRGAQLLVFQFVTLIAGSVLLLSVLGSILLSYSG